MQLLLDRCHFYFLMIFKEMLTFLSISNPVLRYVSYHGTVKLPIIPRYGCKPSLHNRPFRSGALSMDACNT